MGVLPKTPRLLLNYLMFVKKIELFEPPGTPGEAQSGPWRPLGRILDPLELLEASRSALGGLLGASQRPLGQKKSTLDRPLSALGKIPRHVSANKKTLDRLLGAPRRISRQVSAILGAKRVPKGSPRGLRTCILQYFLEISCSVRVGLRRPLFRSWSALGGLRGRKKNS